jgi:hypothetical protein
VVEAVRTATTGTRIWLWGDQALIDIEAKNSLLGRNLLGVYDRYGWHHLGPIWLLVLGVLRDLGGGSPTALVVGSYAIQAVAAVAIVLVANRLRPGGLTAWWAALLLLAYEWSFGLERLGTVWAPYAVALPAALLVLLVADMAANDNPWPSTVGAAVCASFLCQTEISTSLMVGAVVVSAPFLRLVARGRGKGWGWFYGNWRFGGGVLVGVLVLAWLPPLIQQLTTGPGNVVRVFDFFTTHSTNHAWESALKAGNTIFGSFPFRTGIKGGNHDANPRWVLADPVWRAPWLVVYLGAMVAAAVVALVRRQRPAFAVAAGSAVAMVAAAGSVPLVYGPIYPYLVFWMGALVVPAWVALGIAIAPAAGARASAADRLGGLARWGPEALTGVCTAVAVTVSCAFVLSPVPMTGGSSTLGHGSWTAVAATVVAPGVGTVYIDLSGPDAMPDAAAIADQVLQHGRRVEWDPSDLYFLDPSFAPAARAQALVVVCCSRGDPRVAPKGMRWRGRVGGEDIYTS